MKILERVPGGIPEIIFEKFMTKSIEKYLIASLKAYLNGFMKTF